jgi:hypothetical protein
MRGAVDHDARPPVQGLRSLPGLGSAENGKVSKPNRASKGQPCQGRHCPAIRLWYPEYSDAERAETLLYNGWLL